MSDEDHSEARATIWMSAALKTRLKQRELGYGDSISSWTREAMQFRLLIEDELERAGIPVPDDADEREDLVREIVLAGVRNYEPDED